jgi:drug/metabolite transporter (DMT)-like permease
LLLLVTAAIWGFAFVAQRASTEHLGPFTFNAVRFLLGSLSLAPILLIGRRRRATGVVRAKGKAILLGCGAAGVVLFVASSLQQAGVVYTTAGKAGFITGLYVVIVPLIGLLRGQRPGWRGWLGVVAAIAGLYLLTMTERTSIGRGDLLVLVGAFFWALHLQIIEALMGRIPALTLAVGQFAVCAVLSGIAAVAFETVAWASIVDAAAPIIYTGLLSVGVAYTLQVVAQRHVPPTPAAILLSLEAVFATLGGWLALGEVLSARQVVGCAFMLVGMLVAQIRSPVFRRPSVAQSLD